MNTIQDISIQDVLEFLAAYGSVYDTDNAFTALSEDEQNQIMALASLQCRAYSKCFSDAADYFLHGDINIEDAYTNFPTYCKCIVIIQTLYLYNKSVSTNTDQFAELRELARMGWGRVKVDVLEVSNGNFSSGYPLSLINYDLADDAKIYLGLIGCPIYPDRLTTAHVSAVNWTSDKPVYDFEQRRQDYYAKVNYR